MRDEDIPVSAVENDGLPNLEGALDEGMPIGEAEDRRQIPLDRPRAVDDWGTTAFEEVLGEPLDGRLAREMPDLTAEDLDSGPYPQEPPAGRLVDLDQGTSADVDHEMVATDVGRDRGGRSAEEAAVHVTGEPPGATWSDGDGYLEG